jgi:hypothetical protein
MRSRRFSVRPMCGLALQPAMDRAVLIEPTCPRLRPSRAGKFNACSSRHFSLCSVMKSEVQPPGWPSGAAHIGIEQTRRPSLSSVAVFWHLAQASATLLARTMPIIAVSASGPA